jgi:hypothetical protein
LGANGGCALGAALFGAARVTICRVPRALLSRPELAVINNAVARWLRSSRPLDMPSKKGAAVEWEGVPGASVSIASKGYPLPLDRGIQFDRCIHAGIRIA